MSQSHYLEGRSSDRVPTQYGAEDFGAMLQAKPGCYAIFGQGEPQDPTAPQFWPPSPEIWFQRWNHSRCHWIFFWDYPTGTPALTVTPTHDFNGSQVCTCHQMQKDLILFEFFSISSRSERKLWWRSIENSDTTKQFRFKNNKVFSQNPVPCSPIFNARL